MNIYSSLILTITALSSSSLGNKNIRRNYRIKGSDEGFYKALELKTLRNVSKLTI